MTSSPRPALGRRAEHTLGLRRAVVTIFALTTVIPLLLFAHSLWTTGAIYTTQAQVILLLATVIAVLGFVLLDLTFDRISRLARTVARAESDVGPPPRVTDVVPGLGQVAEIGHLTQAFSRLLGELRESTGRLEDLVFKLGTLEQLVDMAARIPSIQDLLSHVLDRTMRAVQARIGSIMLLDSERQVLQVVASRGLPQEVPARAEVRVGEGIAGKVVELGESVLVEDIETDPRFARSPDPKYGNGSFICMPLRVGPRVVGVVNLSKKEAKQPGIEPGPPFGRTDLQFLNTLMTYTALSVDNARLLEEARQTARRLSDVVETQKARLSEAEERVMKAARRSVLGQLVAGLGPALSEPLTWASGSAGALASAMAGPNTAPPALQALRAAVEQARAIAGDLLSLAPETPLHRTAVDLGELIDGVLRSASGDLGRAGIAVEREVAPGLPPVQVDRARFERVLVHLVTSAGQAMVGVPGQRRLRVAARMEEAGHIVLFVTDTGPWIAPDLIPRLFEPYFASPPPGRTGLGLAVAHSVVTRHGGSVTVESGAGGGTTVRVELPVDGAGASGEKKLPATAATPHRQPGVGNGAS